MCYLEKITSHQMQCILQSFYEDNYDEDEGPVNDIESQVNSAVQNCSSDGIQPYPQVNLAKENVGLLPHSEECLDFDYELLQVLSRLDLELYPFIYAL